MQFAGTFLSVLLCGFRRGFSTQNALLRFLEKIKIGLDNKKFAGAILMDLSKAFDCLNRELLIAKLDAYGLGRSALDFIYSYLSARKQRVKVNGSFSNWRETNLGVPQGSVLGPLLFNIYVNDMLYLMEDAEICNYADDTTIYVVSDKIDDVVRRLEDGIAAVLNWFPNNYMKLNEEKCHVMIFGGIHDDIRVKIGTSVIKETKEQMLLGINIDNKLTFKSHVETLCKKAAQKLHALARIANYMETEQLASLMNAFIMSHFSYCPLVWMFHDRNINKKVNKIQERALRIVYKDNHSDFETLLVNQNSASVHQRNLRLLLTEIYKTKSGNAPSFMKEIFMEKVPSYGLRDGGNICLPKVKTMRFGTETVRFLGQKLWRTLPTEIKESESLSVFKRKIKTYTVSCDCRLCERYVENLGYI